MKRNNMLVGLGLSLILPFTMLSADEYTSQTESVVLDSFDDAANRKWIKRDGSEGTQERAWVAKASRYGITPDNSGLFNVKTVNKYPETLYGHTQKEDIFSLGVNASFDRLGYNYIDLIPTVKGEGDKLKEAPIEIEGLSSRIDLWVWGGKYNLNLEIMVEDYRGRRHTLNVGSLDYSGWRNLSVAIPKSIPQTSKQDPHFRPLKLIKMVVRTAPDEKVDNFYIYFDQLRVMTDRFEHYYDGKNLTSQTAIDEIWGNK